MKKIYIIKINNFSFYKIINLKVSKDFKYNNEIYVNFSRYNDFLNLLKLNKENILLLYLSR